MAKVVSKIIQLSGMVGGMVQLQWQDNSHQPPASATDLLSIIAYNATAGEVYFF